MRRTIALLIAAAATSVQAGELFKWIDPASGAAVYSNDPPPAAVRSVRQTRFAPNTIETSDVPYSVQQAVKRSPIVLYVNDCGEFCKAARTYLARRGLPHTEMNPEQPAAAAKLKTVSGGALEVPFLVVGAKSVRGFDEARYASALDAAGYPRSSLAGLATQPGPTKAPTPPTAVTNSGDRAAAKSEEALAVEQHLEKGRAMYHEVFALNGSPF